MKVATKGLLCAICLGCAFILQFIVRGARFLAGSTETSAPDNDRLPHDSELFGEYNFRTGRLDSGSDPDGWYEEDM